MSALTDIGRIDIHSLPLGSLKPYSLKKKIKAFKPSSKYRHPLFITWSEMWRRTTDNKASNYKYYGARGITVDPRWKNFWTFVSDIGNKPSPKHTLDRIDNDRGYSKDNCRWATIEVQNNNKRKSKYTTKRGRLIEFNGKTQTLTEWSKELNISLSSLNKRLNTRKMKVSDAFTKEKRLNKIPITFNGEVKNISEWARTIKINKNTLYQRLFVNKWEVDKALTCPVRKKAK